jgi:hypothetical protein
MCRDLSLVVLSLTTEIKSKWLCVLASAKIKRVVALDAWRVNLNMRMYETSTTSEIRRLTVEKTANPTVVPATVGLETDSLTFLDSAVRIRQGRGSLLDSVLILPTFKRKSRNAFNSLRFSRHYLESTLSPRATPSTWQKQSHHLLRRT